MEDTEFDVMTYEFIMAVNAGKQDQSMIRPIMILRHILQLKKFRNNQYFSKYSCEIITG